MAKATAKGLGLALFLFPSATLAGQSEVIDFYSGNQLFDFCTGGSPACVGYILGVSAARSGDSFCFPVGVTGEQVVTTVKLWLSNHPETLHLPGSQLVTQALSQGFPCH